MSPVICHLSRVTFHFLNFNFFGKLADLIGGGSVINRAYLVYFSGYKNVFIHNFDVELIIKFVFEKIYIKCLTCTCNLNTLTMKF